MKYFKEIAVVIFVLVLCIVILFPIHKDESVLGAFKSPLSFFFGIFIGFSISDRLSRLNKIRENDSAERSSLELLNSYFQSASPENHKKVHPLIDDYLMATLDYSIYDYSQTRPYYDRIATALYSITEGEVGKFGIDMSKSILRAREQTVTLIDDSLSAFEWAVYYILGLGMLVPFIMTNSGTVLNIALLVLISSFVFLLLLFLHKLDSLEWKKEVRIFEPYQKTFEAIGSLHYFPEILMENSKVKKIAGSVYRLGHFPNPYPNMDGKTIKTYGK